MKIDRRSQRGRYNQKQKEQDAERRTTREGETEKVTERQRDKIQVRIFRETERACKKEKKIRETEIKHRKDS